MAMEEEQDLSLKAQEVEVQEEEEKGQTRRKAGLMRRFTKRVDDSLRSFFFRFGYLVSGYPWRTIFISLALSLLCGAGMIRFRTESREDKLWVPQGTLAIEQKEYVTPRYGQGLRLSEIVFEARDGVDLGTKSALLDMITVLRAGEAVQGEPVEPPEGSGEPIIFEKDFCFQDFDTLGNEFCFTRSVLDLFYDPAQLVVTAGKNDFLTTVENIIQDLSDEQIKERLLQGPFVSRSGDTLKADTYISVDSNGKVDAFYYFQLANNNLILEDGVEVDYEADSYEETWTKRLIDEADSIDAPSLVWAVSSGWADGESLQSALSKDLPLFSIGFVLLIFYVTMFLGEFHIVQSRVLLGFMAIATSGLGILIAFGLSSLFGMFYGPVHNILPLLLIGIGVDDIMIITKTLNHVQQNNERIMKSDLRTRIAFALSQSGTAITVTSLTNLTVFAVSAVSGLPALRFFSLWAVVGVIGDYVLSVTFFVACLTIDQRRIDNNRADIIGAFLKKENPSKKDWFGQEFGGFHRLFGNYIGPFIMNRFVRPVIIFLFAALFGVCIWGCTRLYLKFEFSFFYPDGSTSREFQDAVDRHFQNGLPGNVYVRNVDLSTVENQRLYLQLCDPDDGIVARNDWVEGGSVDCWYTKMRAFHGLIDDIEFFAPDEFQTKFTEFLNAPSSKGLINDFVFLEDGTTIESSRFPFTYRYGASNAEYIERLETLREDVDEAGFGEDAFPYTEADIFIEQFRSIPGEVALSLGLACVAVFVVCFLLIGHPVVALISVGLVAIIVTDVVGFLNFTGYNLNSVSVISLAISVGLSVDYVIHITRSFLEQIGTKREMAINALEELGPPVFHSGFSTFLAILILVGSTSYIFQSLFAGFISLIIIGMLHGLLLGPVVLSFIGPQGFYDDQEEKDAAEMHVEEVFLAQKGISEPREEEPQPGEV